MKNKKPDTDKLISDILKQPTDKKNIDDILASFNIYESESKSISYAKNIDDLDDIDEDDDWDDEDDIYDDVDDEDYIEDEEDANDDSFYEENSWGSNSEELTLEEEELLEDYDYKEIEVEDEKPDLFNHPKPSLFTRIFHKKIVVEDIKDEQLYFILFQIRELYPNKPIRIGKLKGYLSW